MEIDEDEKDAVSPERSRERESAAEDSGQEPPPLEREPAAMEPPAVGAGAMLRAARQQRGLNIFEVSERLFLTEHYVRALESGDYDKLPGEVYVKGYMRSYARFLELDPEQVMGAYRQSAAPAAGVSPARAKPARSGRNWFMPLLTAVLLGLVAAAAWWAYQAFGGIAGILAQLAAGNGGTFGQ